MIISKINVSYPCIKYEVRVSHFTSRKSTAIEWVILESIRKVSIMNKYSEVPISMLFKEIFGISDADLLIRPCLLSLQDMGAIIANGIDDETELNYVMMRNLSLTPTGEKMQRDGLLPGATSEDNFVIYYDIVENLFMDNIENNYKVESTGISTYDYEDLHNIDFPNVKIRTLLEEKKKKKKNKFSWLMPTTTLENIECIDSTVLWRSITKKVDLGENLVWHIEGNDDIDLDELSLINAEFESNNEYTNLPLTNIINPNNEIKEIVMISDLRSMIIDNLKKDDLFLVNANFYQDTILNQIKKKNKIRIGVIVGSENYQVEKSKKQLIFKIPSIEIDSEKIYLSKNSLINIGRFLISAGSQTREVILAYIPLKNDDQLKNILIKIVDNYFDKDETILFILKELGLKELFIEYIKRLIHKKNSILEKTEIVENINVQSIKYYNKKCISLNDMEEMLVDKENIINTSQNVQGLLNIIKEYGKINTFKQNEQLFQKVLQYALSNVKGVNSIDDVINIWLELTKIKNTFVRWVSKNNLFEKLYTEEVLIELLDCFSNDNLFEEIDEYTVVEQIILEMKRIELKIRDLLPDISDLSKIYSDECILEILMCNKEKLSDIYNLVSKWNDETEKFNNKVMEINNIIKIDSYIYKVKSMIDKLAESLKIFFNDSTKKYNKIYIVDTCTLINEPGLVSWFNDGKTLLIIPQIVLNELDYLKNDANEEKASRVREVIRIINDYKTEDWLDINEESCPELLSKDLDSERNDNRILSIAIKYCIKKPIILTDDINFGNIASSQKIDSINLKTYQEMKKFEKLNNNKKKKKKRKGVIYE